MNYPLQAIHIPKTIDNDLPFTDCSPGFGSVAKYVAVSTKEASLDIASMCAASTKIFILEVMGRHAGWLAAAVSSWASPWTVDCRLAGSRDNPRMTASSTGLLKARSRRAATKPAGASGSRSSSVCGPRPAGAPSSRDSAAAGGAAVYAPEG